MAMAHSLKFTVIIKEEINIRKITHVRVGV